MNEIFLITAIAAFAFIALLMLIRIHNVDKFRKNLKSGTDVKFFILEEKFYGKIISADKNSAVVEYLTFGNRYGKRSVLISNIYPR